jgi:transposase
MQRQGREFWTKVVDEYETTSGETHAEFAARHRVGQATFECWLHLLRGERSKLAAGRHVHLLPVQVAVGHSEQQVQVEVSGGSGLRVTVGTDPGYVAALVTALCSCTLPASMRIFLATTPVDMRCGHDGLVAIVRNQYKLDLFGGHLFAFIGRRGDQCKILLFDRGGLVLYYKRLEAGTFRLVRGGDGVACQVEIDAAELSLMLEGIDLGKASRRKRFQRETQER